MIALLERLGLARLDRALALGAALAVLLLLVADLGLAGRGLVLDHAWAATAVRWLHVGAAIVWLGLLWYFNLVQIPSLPRIPDAQKPAITQVIAPAALFWFRWAAVATLATGLALAWMNGYLGAALALGLGFGGGRAGAIGIGMWLGIVMAANVWMVIWPCQQKALGLVAATPDERKAAARTALLVSRLNAGLSLPMLWFMVAAQNLY